MTVPIGESTSNRQRASGRWLATGHPHIHYGVAAVDAVLFTALGAILMLRSLGAGVAAIVCGLLAAGLSALPAWWSEQHPQRAAQVVGQRRERSQRMARRHPLYFVVVLPIALAADTALRWHTGAPNDAAHHGLWSWLVPALIGLIGGGIAGTTLVVRARRAKPSGA